MSDERRDHERALELATSAVDFELQPDERAWLDEHLDACPSCRRAERQVREDARAIMRLPDVSAPDRVRMAVFKAVDPRQPREARGRLALALASTFALVLAIGVALSLRSTDDEPPDVGASSVLPSLSPSPSPSASPSASASVPPLPSPAPSAPAGTLALRWRAATIPQDDTAIEIRSLAVGNGVALSAYRRAENVPRLWSTTDGRTWLDAQIPNAAFGTRAPYLIVPFASGFVAIGWTSPTGEGRRIWLSDDGVSWRPDDDPSGTLGPMSVGAMAAGDSMILAGGVSAGQIAMWTSTDATSWVRQELGETFRGATMRNMASDGVAFYVNGSLAGAGAIWRTEDGATWTRLASPPDSSSIEGLVTGPGGILAWGSSGGALNAVWWSADGQDWQRVSTSPLPSSDADRIVRIVPTPDAVLAVWDVTAEPGIRVARSIDGRRWDYLDVRGIPRGVTLATVAQIGSTFVAVGLRDGRVVAYYAAAPR
jgi:putative zinc finger protein